MFKEEDQIRTRAFGPGRKRTGRVGRAADTAGPRGLYLPFSSLPESHVKEKKAGSGLPPPSLDRPSGIIGSTMAGRNLLKGDVTLDRSAQSDYGAEPPLKKITSMEVVHGKD